MTVPSHLGEEREERRKEEEGRKKKNEARKQGEIFFEDKTIRNVFKETWS